MVSPNFKNEVLRILVSDTKHLLSGPVSLFYIKTRASGALPHVPIYGDVTSRVKKKFEEIM